MNLPAVARWRDQAACATHVLPMWTEPSTHPEPRRRAALSREWRNTAIAICNGCPVRSECLTEGLDADRAGHAKGNYPIFGGFTAAERAHYAHMSSSATPRAEDRSGPPTAA